MEDIIVRRTVQIGGTEAAGLRHALEAAGVALNVAGAEILAHPAFSTAAQATVLEVVEVTVAGLGLPGGGCWGELVAAAQGRGLDLCPLEVGPHLRLRWLDQPEAPPTVVRGCAPPGSVTVASVPVEAAGGLWGFYLRRIEGVLWLRGYWSDAEHVWSAGDRLLFAVRAGPGRGVTGSGGGLD